MIPIHVPPLRERREDIVPLARHFLARWNSDLGRRIAGWSDAVADYLERHTWPGNVRELENAIERGVVLARGDRIEFDDLLVDPDGDEASEASSDSGRAQNLHEFLDAAAAERIRAALAESGGVKVDAARRLGIDRTTLYRLMRKYAIDAAD